MNGANVHPPAVVHRDALAAAVLAGGASRRFGSDKARFRIVPNGPTLLERSVRAVQHLTPRVAIIGDPAYRNLDLGVPIQPDDRPGQGPLEGIATALRLFDPARVLVVACDMPCLSPALLRWMAGIETDAQVVVPQTGDGRFQPMHAIYVASVLPAVDAALDRGERAVRSIYSDVVIRVVTEEEMRAIDPRLDSLVSLNRIDEIDRAKECIRES